MWWQFWDHVKKKCADWFCWSFFRQANENTADRRKAVVPDNTVISTFGFQNALSEFHQFRKYDQIVWILTFDADNSNFVDFQSNSGVHMHFQILITISVRWYYECSFVVCRENTENQLYIEAGKVLFQRKKTFDKKWKDFISYLLILRDYVKGMQRKKKFKSCQTFMWPSLYIYYWKGPLLNSSRLQPIWAILSQVEKTHFEEIVCLF